MTSKKFFSKVTEPIDHWLEAQGLYRKQTAHDPSCLFRAVAEQVYFSQCCHEIVRKQCVNFIAANKTQFEKVVDGSMENYLSKLSNPKEWGSHMELNALSLLYQREVILFEQGEKPSRISINNIFKEDIMLCYTSENHYDSVYTKSYIMKAAFCQSVVYEVLYKNVFRLQNVDFAVDKMLHKSSQTKREHYLQQNYICAQRSLGLPLELTMKTVRHLETEGYEEELNVKELLARGMTPFPYKVAKALDPDIYRNIEFDVWSDIRREVKFGVIGGNSDELQIGVKCLVKMQADRVFHAHIQEMEPNNGPVVVFVEELGRKCTVSHDVLEPLPKNQKVQWALPYKHQRHPTSLPSKSPFFNMAELSTKWRKNKYNKSRKLKDLFMPAPPTNVHCTSNGQPLSFHQDQMPNSLHYSMDPFNYNQSNVSVSSSEECSNESSHMIQTDNTVSSSVLATHPEASLSSSTSPSPVEDLDENVCSPPMQIVGVPLYQSLCTDSSGMRVSTQPVGSSMPSYILCNGNPQGVLHPAASNVENYTLQPVNFYAQKSVNLNGSDLPFSDIPTLRFYYNLGHDYFRLGYMMWPTTGSACTSNLPSSNTSDSNQQLQPDSTTFPAEDEGQKALSVQPIPLVHQQMHSIPHVISSTIAHSVPVVVPQVPSPVTSVSPVGSPGIAANVISQMVPVTPPPPPPPPPPPQIMTHSLPQKHQVSPSPVPQPAVYPVLPQSPSLQPPVYALNNMWASPPTTFVNSQPRICAAESDSRPTPVSSSEDSNVKGNDAKNMNSCHSNMISHPLAMESYSQPTVYPYCIIEMNSVPYYSPHPFIMQSSTEMDMMTSTQIHTVQPSTDPAIPPVLYHVPNVYHSPSVPHWISPDGVPQYTVAM